MKVKIEYTIDVSDEYREAINIFYGKQGMASRDDVKRWIRSYGSSQDDDLMYEWQKVQEEVDALIEELGRPE